MEKFSSIGTDTSDTSPMIALSRDSGCMAIEMKIFGLDVVGLKDRRYLYKNITMSRSEMRSNSKARSLASSSGAWWSLAVVYTRGWIPPVLENDLILQLRG